MSRDKAVLPLVAQAARGALLAIVIVASLPAAATAQDPTFGVRLPKVGSRMRVTSFSALGGRVTGTLRAVHGDSLVLQRDGDRALVALAQGDLEQVEVRVGEKEAEQLATVFGIAGAVGGGVVYVNWCRQNSKACQEDAWGSTGCYYGCDEDEDESHFQVPTLLIVGGAVLGAAIGYGLAAPRWKVLGAPARFGVAPLGARGVVVGARISVGQLGLRR